MVTDSSISVKREEERCNGPKYVEEGGSKVRKKGAITPVSALMTEGKRKTHSHSSEEMPSGESAIRRKKYQGHIPWGRGRLRTHGPLERPDGKERAV